MDELIVEVHYDLGNGDEPLLRKLLTGFEVRFEELPQPNRCLLHAYQAA